MVNPDFRDLFAALNEAHASYLVVGAHAVAFYAEPRYTKDLDVWVEATPEMAPRTLRALLAFGAPADLIEESDFAKPAITAQAKGRAATHSARGAAVTVAFPSA